jgi:hypothetical protein
MAHSSGDRPGPRPAARRARAAPPSGSRLLAGGAQPEPGPRDKTPYRAHVRIREIPQAPPRRASRADVILHLTTAVLAVTLLVVLLLWLR